MSALRFGQMMAGEPNNSIKLTFIMLAIHKGNLSCIRLLHSTGEVHLMKSTILILLQQRMDKCGFGQLWAVATVTGLCALVVTQRNTVLAALPPWLIVVSIVGVTTYAVYYILHRHVTYYCNVQALVALLQDEPECPEILKASPTPWRLRSLIGSGFYVLWVVGAGLMSIVSVI